MEKSFWTFMVVPHDNVKVRSLQVSQKSLSILFLLLLASLFLLGTIIYGYYSKSIDQQQISELERENILLTSKLDDINRKVFELSKDLDQLSVREQQFRVLANLDDIPTDVRAMGVGGSTLSRAEIELLELDSTLGEKVIENEGYLDALLRTADLVKISLDQVVNSAEENDRKFSHTPSISPTIGGWITSTYGERMHPIYHERRPHKAIDISARRGTPIRATADGVVRIAGYNRTFGSRIVIDHGNGFETVYAHCDKLKVSAGKRIKRGEIIATMGSTGVAKGPHVHYEVHINSKAVDPQRYILGEAIPD